MKKFEGIYTALVTPFDREGRINAGALQKLVSSNLEDGVNGFYISGSTGESYLLSMDERKYLLEAVKEAAGDETDLLVNIGMFYTEHSIELAKHAEKCGVSAISSVPPFYFPFNREEYRQYYTQLADAVDVPVIVYNIPAMSSVIFSTEELAGFLENGKIAGIKHTSYDLFQLQQLVAAYPQKSIFIGHDEIYLSAITAGARAGIGSTYNIMADKFVRINELVRQKDMTGALKVQNEVNEVIAILCKVGVFKGIKEILRMKGIDCGECRRPFLPLKAEEKKLLRETAEKHHIL